MKRILDQKTLKFILVGIVNTIIGSSIMFLCYNLFHVSYWLSSAYNYFFTSILSYYLNKRFTFQDKSKVSKSGVKFIINIAICYVLAYGIAKPVISVIFGGISLVASENIAMLAGMFFFTGFNYIGQRFFVFNKEKV